MEIQTQITTKSSIAIETQAIPDTNYADVLQSFGVHCKQAEYYLQVGEIVKTQGWIIHLSVVLSQVRQLLEIVIPFLKKQGIAFKIPMSNSVSEDILKGNVGVTQIGKICVIYPENDLLSVKLAKELISLTQPFKGPSIPTDICLGSIVYTKYGSFNPIVKLDLHGTERKYIYDDAGHLTEDLQEIPFRLPDRVTWPFKELAAPSPPQLPISFNHVYKVTDILKQDPRGNVYIGLYLKNLLNVNKCVIKQGFRNMDSDLEGRDIQDRLKWQSELHEILSHTIPLPHIYDLYQEEHFTMLIMEYVRGCSLLKKLSEINNLASHWQDLTTSQSTQILKYAIEITKLIDKLHKKGYVHRDINPVNFLIDKKDRMVLIDIELAYSIEHNKPDPPFRQGTPGFMSPQQANFYRPTIADDIYGLGATFLYMFTGLLPVQLNPLDVQSMAENLNFLIGSREIAELISNCLHTGSKRRPGTYTIISTLNAYNESIQARSRTSTPHGHPGLNDSQLKEVVSSALIGLNQPPVIVSDDLWLSKQITTDNLTARKAKQFWTSPGIAEGISGVLYMLAKVYRVGIPINSCLQGFTKGWQTLQNNYCNNLSKMPYGLYNGTAGLALALAEGIKSGLLEDTNLHKEIILECLRPKTDGLNIANGIAGQGVSLLGCKEFLKKDAFNGLIGNIIQELLAGQKPNGSWLEPSRSKKGNTELSSNMSFDDTGIALFLLDYLSVNSNSDIQKSVTKAIQNIIANKKYMAYSHNQLASQDSYNFGDGGKGIIMLLIKAYDILHENKYRKLATTALLKYPSRIIHPNFTQENGLAAIGEIYLEAYRVFKTEEWKDRANWIADIYIHSFFRNKDGSGHWVMDQNNPPTAGFLTGISGVIYFLARCCSPDKLRYRLFN